MLNETFLGTMGGSGVAHLCSDSHMSKGGVADKHNSSREGRAKRANLRYGGIFSPHGTGRAIDLREAFSPIVQECP